MLPKGVTRIKAPHGVKGLSAIRVAGGHLQVFFHRQALCVFASDTKKGQATGQGVEGAWFAALSDDKSSAPASTTTTTSPGTPATTGTVPPTSPPEHIACSENVELAPSDNDNHAQTLGYNAAARHNSNSRPTPPQTTTTQPPTTTTTTTWVRLLLC